MASDAIVIVSAARTPMGGFMGDLAPLSANELGAAAIKSALERANLGDQPVDEVLMGNVLGAGQGQAPARQAMLKAGLDRSVSAVTLNKVCGSGLKAVMVAYDQLKAGNGALYVAGGMESMSNAPYLLPKLRAGARFGHAQAIDHMAFDGLEDGCDSGQAMGVLAEDCAGKYQFSREAQDEYALESLSRAQAAQTDGRFDTEIAPVTISGRKGDVVISHDEQPGKARPEKIPHLKPAFKKDGTITAANASSISDGAAAMVLMRESEALDLGLKPLARILSHAGHSQEPQWFTTAPVGAMNNALKKAGLKADDIDLFEINEAFAVVPMAAMTELGLARKKVNIYGGACALGHPIGASGARILVTLVHALESEDKKLGLASLCIGGGEGVAMVIERL